MDWVMEFFETIAAWWGPPKIQKSDQERVSILTQVVGPPPKRILELGAGGGTTAVVAAHAGFDVTAIELAPARAQFTRNLAEQYGVENLTVVEGDFYVADVGGPFDAVMYWNGFGVGNDKDQRRILRRVHDDWLLPDGKMVLDVFNPIPWAAKARMKHTRRAAIELVNVQEFDPISSRFIDTWWPVDNQEAAVTQYGRCYSLTDFALLLEGTGLDLYWAAARGELLDLTKGATSHHDMWEVAFYTCGLVRAED